MVSIIYSGKHFYYVLAELVCGFSQKKKDQEKFLFGRRSQSRATTTTTLFVCACVHAHSDSEQKRTQSCVFSYVVRMFYLYLCLCVYLKGRKIEDMADKTGCSPKNQHSPRFQDEQACRRVSATIMFFRISFFCEKCELSCCDKSLSLNKYRT